MKDLASYGTK